MKKKSYTSEYKAKIVIEVLRGEKTLGEIAAREYVNPNQIGNWKREFLERSPEIFSDNKKQKEIVRQRQTAENEKNLLLKTIGQLTLERDYLRAAAGKLADRGLL
jgi:transposase-like protein